MKIAIPHEPRFKTTVSGAGRLNYPGKLLSPWFLPATYQM
jgi:hypothetical protein